ncbi:MAG: hypothetical protein ABFE16_00580 [Armatimonadia bacterium]
MRNLCSVAVVALGSALASMPAVAGTIPWDTTYAPEGLPQVTVRWEDPEQREVFVVEGQEYQCRVATWPAKILSLRVHGKDLLGPEGLSPSFVDAQGSRYTVAPRDLTPVWDVWRRRWTPASDSRARMNVWSASPYYWDAHLLEIPLVTEGYLAARSSLKEGRLLAGWDFQADAEGWRALHSCTVEAKPEGTLLITATGDDPYLESPAVSVAGPLQVVLRMRTQAGGGAALYWTSDTAPEYGGGSVATFPVTADGEWHEYRVPIQFAGKLTRVRLDPPGETGTTEVEWVRLQERPQDDPKAPKPARGELVFHAYADQLRIEFRVDQPEGQPAPQRAILEGETPGARVETVGERPLLKLGEGEGTALVLGRPRATFDPEHKLWSARMEDARPGTYWVMKPTHSGTTTEALFANDLFPMGDNAVSVTGGYWLGYDEASGLYRVQVARTGGGYSFEEGYMNPSRRASVGLRFHDESVDRSMIVKCMTGIGCLEASVLTDEYGFPLPTPAFVCKNFGGELEEPDDSAYGDSYFPVALEANQDKSLQVANLIQGWGNHMLKQVSSIRFFNIYWHLSTGASETTCFTHNWMQIGRSGVLHIPDFRPLSGPFTVGQPQHGCVQWPGFLQYNGGKGRLVYEKTVLESVSPCLARFTLHYHTSDDTARARLSVMEIPQRDEMRTFVRLRYDWEKPVEIVGDARLNFRWLNLFEKRMPAALIYTDAEAKTQQVAMKTDDTPMLTGVPLTKQSPFVGSVADAGGYGCVVLVRGFRARLGGVDYDQAAVSAQFGTGDGSYWLTVPTETLKLLAGDFVEAEVMLMPHGEPTLPAFKAERERTERFGDGVPVVKEVKVGEKLSDFPARVQAAEEVAAFSIEGGFDYMPLIVEGFQRPGVPILWRGDLWQDQQVGGGDGYQVEGDGKGGYRFVFLYPVRRGQGLSCMVTRADCTTGISRMYDENGRLVLEAPQEGEFHLKAPVLFGPGRNVLTAGAPVLSFTGQGTRVAAVPVSVSPVEGRAVVETNAKGDQVRVAGAATVTFSQLQPGGVYQVTVDGVATTQAADQGRLQVQVKGPESRIAIALLK